MRISRLLFGLSLCIAMMFFSMVFLVRPLWSDIHAFLGISLPVMPIAAIFGGSCVVYALYLLFREKPIEVRRWVHYLILAFTDLLMVVLLYILLTELGTERSTIAQNVVKYLPYALWFGAALLLFWLAPTFPPLWNWRVRAAAVIVLFLAALIWANLPLRMAIESGPAVYLNQDGLTVAWMTNMRGTSQLAFGESEAMGSTVVYQVHGLNPLGERIQRIDLPGDVFRDMQNGFYFQVSSEGVRRVFPTSAVLAGSAESEVLHLNFPEPGDPLSFVAFSDLHEQTELSRVLAEQVNWEEMDFAVYVGDLLNNTASPEQVGGAVLDLPTGGRVLPRVFVRGNHETRGEGARALADWLLPPGGSYYFTFTLGDTFFIVLDSGEDKEDSDREYSGLVDFTSYHQNQAAWLADVLESPAYLDAAYQVLFVHIPPFDESTQAFAPVVELLEDAEDIDLALSGHIHEAGIWSEEETGLPFTVVTCGGSSLEDAAVVIVQIDAKTIEVEIVDAAGEVVGQAEFTD